MSTKFPVRPLGTTDMEITRVGFGAWATGGGEWGPQDDTASIASINRALARSRPIGFSTIRRANGCEPGGVFKRAVASPVMIGANIAGGTAR